MSFSYLKLTLSNFDGLGVGREGTAPPRNLQTARENFSYFAFEHLKEYGNAGEISISSLTNIMLEHRWGD